MAIDLNLETISSGYNISKINTNFYAVQTGLGSALSRDGTAPNMMEASFDLNGNDILNGGTANFETLIVDGEEFFPSEAAAIGPTGPTGATGATGATGPGVATGGTTGQALVKSSGTDYATTWADRIGGSLGSTDNRLLRADGTGGLTAQNSLIVVNDSGQLTAPADILASTTGATPSSPRVIGMTGFASGEAGRFKFGDDFTSMQVANGGKLQVQSYHGIELIGGRASGTALAADTTGAGTSDPSTMIRTSSGVAAQITLAIKQEASQTGNLTEWRDSSNNVLSAVTVGGLLRESNNSPVTKTGNFTVAVTEKNLINNKSGSTCVVTLPTASSFTGRELYFNNEQAQLLNSASSNVVPKVGGSAAASILPATAGAWAKLVSNGTSWKIMMSGT